MSASRHAAGSSVAGALLVLLFASSGWGDVVRRGDADDSPSRLDIRSIRHAHDGNRLVHRVRTFEGWRNRILADGSTWIELWFNIDGDATLERRLTIDVDDEGTLRAVMQKRSGAHIGYGRARRPNRTTLVVRFRPRLLAEALDRYRWYAFTRFHADAHPECGSVDDMVILCGDRAPGPGTLTHRL